MASDTLTDTQIAELVAMPKRVENPNAKARSEGGHSRSDFRIVSTDGSHEFALFTRQSSLLPEGYSAGLRWLAKSGVYFGPVTLAAPRIYSGTVPFWLNCP